MPSFLKFLIFIFIILLLPIFLSIFENISNIVRLFKQKNSMNSKLIEFSKNEFIGFIKEFFSRSNIYSSSIEKNGNDIYLNNGSKKCYIYYDNLDNYKFTMYDARKVIGISESKGVNEIFVFTTKILDECVINFFDKLRGIYNINYLDGREFELSYTEFANKFYKNV